MIQQSYNADSDELTARCDCGQFVTVPNKGLGRAKMAAWKSRHDPLPWARFPDGPSGHRFASNPHGNLYWYPRPVYECGSSGS